MSGLTVIVPATDDPPTLGRCLSAIGASHAPPDELLVVREPHRSGPARARNLAAGRASGDLLVFVDADVVIHPDALGRIRDTFAAEPGLVAVFGSYDADPDAPGTVSRFRNLLHHHVHQRGAGPADTFWAGLGAVRRDAFLAVGGFDAERFRRPSIEDIDLGLRLVDAGGGIRLDPAVLGTHLKRWSLRGMVDPAGSRVALLLHRGRPWVQLIARRRAVGGSLNLGRRHLMSALACLGAVACLGARRPRAAGACVGALVVLNRDFYALLWCRGGPLEAAAGVALHVVHHLTAVAAVPVGLAAHLVERHRRRAGG